MMKILFVCLGNICRSPTAQGVFETRLQRHLESIGQTHRYASDFEIDSAGTAAWHIGKSPDSRSQMAAKGRGYDLSQLKARQVQTNDFAYFDYILAMDKANLDALKTDCAADYQHKLALFLDYSDYAQSEVPDPYYGGEEGFQHVLDLIESASDGLIAKLIQGTY